MTISVKHMFERRLGLFPVTFDADGTMHADTALGDYPQIAPALRAGARGQQPRRRDAGVIRQEDQRIVEPRGLRPRARRRRGREDLLERAHRWRRRVAGD